MAWIPVLTNSIPSLHEQQLYCFLRAQLMMVLKIHIGMAYMAQDEGLFLSPTPKSLSFSLSDSPKKEKVIK